jgi:pSer/pThr/pTyr-binding forkhead associated (FHA) protein
LEEAGIGLQHFHIRYSAEEKKYYIKDLSQGSGTFIKIQAPLKLQTSQIISFGGNHVTVLLGPENKYITLKCLEGIRTNEKFTFSPESLPITIGRTSGNDIIIDSLSVSRKQCKYLCD